MIDLVLEVFGLAPVEFNAGWDVLGLAPDACDVRLNVLGLAPDEGCEFDELDELRVTFLVIEVTSLQVFLFVPEVGVVVTSEPRFVPGDVRSAVSTLCGVSCLLGLLSLPCSIKWKESPLFPVPMPAVFSIPLENAAVI